MKTKTLLSILALGLFVSVFGQKPTLELTFTAENSGQYVPLDSIFIENLTQGGDTTLYYPDTVLILDYITGVNNMELMENPISISQNYPNPFEEKTTIDLYLLEKDKVTITIQDILGRELVQYENTLNSGIHSFNFYPGNDKYYIFYARTGRGTEVIKMACKNTNGKTTCKLDYTGQKGVSVNLKSLKEIDNFGFSLGDQLRYIAYAFTLFEVNGSDVIEDAPQMNELYEFNISEGIPCPGIPTITYENKVYNTLLVGSQCWLKENLNVGIMIDSSENMSNNGTIEKYCYNNDPVNCYTYGGLYQWDEMMQYTTIQGTQGICPPDWHLPDDEEWKQLEGTVDSQYGYPDPEWDDTGYRGFDAGEKLKSTSGWNSSGNGTDEFGFTALPGGFRNSSGSFDYIGYNGKWWSSSEDSGTNAWYRGLNYDNNRVYRHINIKTNGHSVRCLKN